jgi:hypothetical protein
MTPTVSAALLALAESALHIAARWHLVALDTSRMTSGAQHVASDLQFAHCWVPVWNQAKSLALSDDLMRCHEWLEVM